MDAVAHDCMAYVSHISHITSFALANTVLEKEKEDDAILN
jgi:prephenate dehydrogenase